MSLAWAVCLCLMQSLCRGHRAHCLSSETLAQSPGGSQPPKRGQPHWNLRVNTRRDQWILGRHEGQRSPRETWEQALADLGSRSVPPAQKL